MNWIERVLGETRGTLLALLRRSRRTVNELADALGVTDNAVRTHVAAMQRDGMVQAAGVERMTGGKPAQYYEITPAAEEMFPKAYALVLSGLIGLLEEKEGRERVVSLLREVGARAGAAGRAGGGDDEARVRAAAETLRRLGGDVDLVREGSGWRIQGYGCPLSAIAGEHGEVCSLAESLVSEIAGKPVRECCDRSGRPRCAFEIAG